MQNTFKLLLFSLMSMQNTSISKQSISIGQTIKIKFFELLEIETIHLYNFFKYKNTVKAHCFL